MASYKEMMDQLIANLKGMSIGQKVATLMSGERQAGTCTIQWDGRDDDGLEVASGVYLYRLRTGGQVQVRKLVKVGCIVHFFSHYLLTPVRLMGCWPALVSSQAFLRLQVLQQILHGLKSWILLTQEGVTWTAAPVAAVLTVC